MSQTTTISSLLTNRAQRMVMRVIVLFFVIGSAGAEPADADYTAQTMMVDTSGWECKFCPFEAGTQAEIESGLGFVSDDSFRFGDFSGLDESGFFPLATATLRQRALDGFYFDADLNNLGLDSRSLLLQGGQQGYYSLYLGYRELPRRRYDTAVTPFNGEGGDRLTLPAGWTTAGTTGGMSDLATSQHDVQIQHDRRRLDLGAAVMPAPQWEFGANLRHETRKGIDRIGGAFVTQSSILPAPLDYVTDMLDVTANYATRQWHAQLAYYGSQFSNNDNALTWQNPYTALAPGADQGRLARAPDNQSHQILFSSSYAPSTRAQVSGSLAIGRMTQDEDLIPATINPNLMTALPRDSAEAQVDTLAATLRAFFAATDRLRLNAEYLYNDRNNKTPQDSFTQVQTDVFVAAPRTNLPYSYTDNTLKFGADYRTDSRTRLTVGIDHQIRERDHHEIDRTEENTLWSKLRLRSQDNTEVAAKLAIARRTGSDFEPVTGVPPENPLHRAFNLADRNRVSTGLRYSFMPREGVLTGLSVDYADDDFFNSDIGLINARSINLTADASATLHENLVLNGYVARGVIRHEQAGSQGFAGPDWSAKNSDKTNALGIGMERRAILPNIDLSGQYAYTRSDGRIRTDSGAGDPAFPKLATRLHSLFLSGIYHWKPDTDLKLGYRHERFSDNDWQVDAVMPATIPNVLSFGQGSPDYRVNVITFSANYRF